MRLPSFALRFLRGRLAELANSRKPDFIIGDNYLRRWWVIPRNRFFNIYLHHFCRSDEDRALHDHPFYNLSCLLKGRYVEHTPGGHQRTYNAGDMKARTGKSLHRIELFPSETCWSLFITGPHYREWGFLCPKGWRHWRDFVNLADPGQVGRGCGEE